MVHKWYNFERAETHIVITNKELAEMTTFDDLLERTLLEDNARMENRVTRRDVDPRYAAEQEENPFEQENRDKGYAKARKQAGALLSSAVSGDGDAELCKEIDTRTGPLGGISFQVSFTVKVDGHLYPVVANIYAGERIDRLYLEAQERNEHERTTWEASAE